MKLSEIRVLVKGCKTPSAIVKQMYVYAEDCKELKGVLPKKQVLLNCIPTICEKYNVGTIKTTSRCSYTIKFSMDMVCKFLANYSLSEMEIISNSVEEERKKALADKAQKGNKGGQQKAA